MARSKTHDLLITRLTALHHQANLLRRVSKYKVIMVDDKKAMGTAWFHINFCGRLMYFERKRAEAIQRRRFSY